MSILIFMVIQLISNIVITIGNIANDNFFLQWDTFGNTGYNTKALNIMYIKSDIT